MAKDHPILFTGDMVRAILDGRKTQTRRVIKGFASVATRIEENRETTITEDRNFWWASFHHRIGLSCPYGVVGDKLWVREGHRIRSVHSKGTKHIALGYYLADDIQFRVQLTKRENELWNARKKPFVRTPGRFMYKSLARLWLEITNIRVERAQDISVEDAQKEGLSSCVVDPYPRGCFLGVKGNYAKNYGDETDMFMDLWDSINAKRGFGWEKNPWVWVIEFKRAE